MVTISDRPLANPSSVSVEAIKIAVRTGSSVKRSGRSVRFAIASFNAARAAAERRLGRALLQAGLQRCADLEAPAPWLTTNSENTAAIGFYQRMGFEITGETAFCLGTQSYPNTLLTYCPESW